MLKRWAIVGAALTGAAPLWAQSSVTIYGIADAGLVRIDNVAGSGRTALDSGYLQSSRLGFRGTEDLGGGLSAIFTLESGFNIDTGANTSPVYFNRQSFMGLSSRTLGRLTMGRQYTNLYDQLILLAGAPAFGVAGGAVDGIPSAGSSATRFDNTLGGTRIDNSLKYQSPSFGGWRVDALYGFGEVAASSSAGRTTSLGLGYNQGPVQVGMGYQVRNCVAAVGCSPTQDKDKVGAIGAGYNFGAFKLAGIYSNQKNAKNVAGNDADVWHAMVQVPVGPWFLSAGVQQLNDKTVLARDVRQYNLSALYYLSKRTTVYGAWSTQKVDNGGLAGMALTTSNDSKQNVMALGIRHTF
jgi:GBP family porin